MVFENEVLAKLTSEYKIQPMWSVYDICAAASIHTAAFADYQYYHRHYLDSPIKYYLRDLFNIFRNLHDLIRSSKYL